MPASDLPSADLASQPWRHAPPPPSILGAKGMIGPKERACFYWFGRNYVSGAGHIVDAGAFAGASTLALAAGAKDAGFTNYQGKPLVQAYDYFKAVDEYVTEAITRDFRPIQPEESYLDIFQAQTESCAALIEPHPGDFMQQSWIGAPIELLFIDIAKTAELNSHIVEQFFGHLIPGRSIVIQQDYFHCWHPYIHIGMEFLADEFELLDDYVPHQSRVWRLVKPLPQAKLDRLIRYDLSAEERIALLDRLIGQASPFMRPMIEVVRIWQLCLDQHWAEAARSMTAFRATHDLSRQTLLWAKQALEVEPSIPRQFF